MSLIFLFFLLTSSMPRAAAVYDLMKTDKPTETTAVVISYFLECFSPVYSSEYNFIFPTILYTLVYIHVCRWYPASRVYFDGLLYMFLFYVRKLSYSIILSVKNWNTKNMHGRGPINLFFISFSRMLLSIFY